MLKNWFKIFLYNVKNNKLFTSLNILGLSIGIAGLIFAMLYWNEEHSYNSWIEDKDRTFQVTNDLGDLNLDIWSTNLAATGELLQASSDDLESYCYVNDWYSGEIISYKGNKIICSKITDAQKNFFSFIPFEFIKGNPKTALSANSIVLSEKTAKALFGDENPINKQIKYAKGVKIVKGVYRVDKRTFFEPEAVINNIETRLAENKDEWGNFNFALLVKLKNPAAKEKTEKQIENIYYENRIKRYAKNEGISPEEYLKKNGNIKVHLEPLSQVRLHTLTSGGPEGKGNYQFLVIMFGLSILILILSITNYVNLATANAIKRAKEVGIRKILGATKGNIIRQFIFETVITAIIAILISLVVVELSLPYYNDFLNKTLMLHSNEFYVQLIVIFIIVVITAGIFPAVYVSNFETLKVLKGNFSRSKSGVWLRNGMLILQFAIASFFIIGSYIVYSQVNHMANMELGFNGDQVVQVQYRNFYDWKDENYQEKLFNRYYTIKRELSKIKGVQQVTTGAFDFGNGANSSSGFKYKDVNNIQGQNMAVDFGMLEMMQIKIVKGRGFSEKYALDTVNSVMVNETALKMMKEKDPIGKIIHWNNKDLKIVGIVDDFNVTGPQNEIPPMTFFHFKTITWMLGNVSSIYVKVDAENMQQTIADIEKFWTTKVDTEYPFSYDFVNKNYARTYEDYIKQKNLFSLLNIIVILIAVFGLFALASYSIQRKMKEIAIRKTLGAETGVLLKELSKQYILFCIAGFAIALLPVYYLLDKWLENFAFRIDISPMPFIVGFIVLLMLTLVVVLSRAYQATKVNVLKYLKYE
ncbi:ABC transporter permease [Flavobacterium sp. MK4S-17]|uniref:ABC transporter permease n=1 Tax=Flavobacterium sp. MK4S-17 TaxID=2543737 RepID=UPI00135810F6|nr:ABC transporter permease [Flavobacterium sp. MK4S-17]